MNDTEPQGDPTEVTLLVQISPLYKHEDSGERVSYSGDLQTFADSLTRYLVDNLGKFSEPRFADMYLVCVVKRGSDETVSREYRSGHYVREETSDGAGGS